MRLVGVFALACSAALGQDDTSLTERVRGYLTALIRIDSTNPPGNETRVANYLKQIADAEGIPCQLLGSDPDRLNFVARLSGSGEARPLLLMAHSDVVPADAAQWSAHPLSAEIVDGRMYGRGALDDKSLLAAEMGVLVELKRRGVRLRRDVIVLAEADEESGSTGIQWLIKNAYGSIEAEFAINEGGFAMNSTGGQRIFHVQTAEKIPSRVVLTARGTAGHGSLPRPDNPIVRLARAITRIVDADQPVKLNSTTRRYLQEIALLAEYRWLAPLVPRLDSSTSAGAVANQIRRRDPEINALLRTTVSPTMLSGGVKINVIPNVAEARVDVRRLPGESRAEVLARLRQAVRDTSVEIVPAGGQEMPATEPSSLTTELYRRMEQVILEAHPSAAVIPYMTRGATDGAFLRQKGMAVYGAPIFLREEAESRSHGNNERISLRNLSEGTLLLWQIMKAVVEQR
jgi:acetylornithine deacetylase/succinyl-diaminopimelate desuccinylase-like protein